MRSFFLIGVALLISSCGSPEAENSNVNFFNNNQNSNGKGSQSSSLHISPTLSAGFIDFPSDTDPLAIRREDVPAGTWRISRIKSQNDFLQYSAVLRADHTMNTPGFPDNGDPYSHSASWGSATNIVGWVEHALPTTFSGPGFNLSSTYYYFTQEFTDGRWSWSIDDHPSSDGIPFASSFRSFALMDGKSKTYSGSILNAKGMGIVTLSNNVLRVYIAARIPSSQMPQNPPQVTILYEYTKQ